MYAKCKIKRELKHNIRKDRIQSLAIRYGANKTLRNLCRYKETFDSFVRLMQKICKLYDIAEPELEIILNLYNTNRNTHALCKYCGNIFNGWNYSYRSRKRNATLYCSKECLSAYDKIHYSEQRSIRAVNMHKNPEYKEKLSKAQIESWASLNNDDRKIRYDKMQSKVDFKNRGKIIIQRKFDLGIISHIKSNTEERKRFLEYKNSCISITKKNDLTILENFDNRGKHTYHLDHIYPIAKGFIHGIPSEYIGHIENLRMLDAQTNRIKSDKIEEIPKHIMEYLNENKINQRD